MRGELLRGLLRHARVLPLLHVVVMAERDLAGFLGLHRRRAADLHPVARADQLELEQPSLCATRPRPQSKAWDRRVENDPIGDAVRQRLGYGLLRQLFISRGHQPLPHPGWEAAGKIEVAISWRPHDPVRLLLCAELWGITRPWRFPG